MGFFPNECTGFFRVIYPSETSRLSTFQKFQNGERKKGEGKNGLHVAVMKNVICDGGETDDGGVGIKHISGTKCKWEYTCVNFRGRYYCYWAKKCTSSG